MEVQHEISENSRGRANPVANGYWAVEVAKTGQYAITLRQQPEQASCAIQAASAGLKIGEAEASKPVPEGATDVVFRLDLPVGRTRLQTWLSDKSGASRGAFFVEVKRENS